MQLNLFFLKLFVVVEGKFDYFVVEYFEDNIDFENIDFVDIEIDLDFVDIEIYFDFVDIEIDFDFDFENLFEYHFDFENLIMDYLYLGNMFLYLELDQQKNFLLTLVIEYCLNWIDFALK